MMLAKFRQPGSTAVMIAALMVIGLLQVGPASATSDCYNQWGSSDRIHGGTTNPAAGDVLNGRVGSAECWDRVVIDLGGGDPSYRIGYVPSVIGPGSGEAIKVDGGAFLQLDIGAPAYDDNGNPTLTQAKLDRLNFAGRTTLRDLQLAGSFEGYTTLGIGVRARLPYRIFRLNGPGTGSRLVIDIAHRWPSQPDGNGPGYVKAGDRLIVVGVGANDVLNVRSGPANSKPVLARLSPTGRVTATGAEAVPAGGGLWYEVTTSKNVTGWANARFLAFKGLTDDATAEYRAGLKPGDQVVFGSVDGLGRHVAQAFASTDPASRIVLSSRPPAGSLAEVVFDVIGIGDDAVGGYRLHIFAEQSAGGYRVRTIERTYLCTRGVSSGSCA